MPRAKGSFLKTKNKAGNEDFKRKKKKMRKIGHRSGDTQINIRSRSLQMTEQSISTDKGEIVSSRNLTLAEVLRQCDHHNFKNRVSALEGLRDIFQGHPLQLLPNLQDVLNATLPLMIDIESPVRSEFRVLLAFLLSMLQRSVVLTPFMTLIAAYLKSALTNLNADVRWSAVAPLNQLLVYDVSLLAPFKLEIIPLLIRLMRANKSTIEVGPQQQQQQQQQQRQGHADAGAGASPASGSQQPKAKKKKNKNKKNRTAGLKFNYGMAIDCVRRLLVTDAAASGAGAGAGGSMREAFSTAAVQSGSSGNEGSSVQWNVTLENAFGSDGSSGRGSRRGGDNSSSTSTASAHSRHGDGYHFANAAAASGGHGDASSGSGGTLLRVTVSSALATPSFLSTSSPPRHVDSSTDPGAAGVVVTDLPGAIRASMQDHPTSTDDVHRSSILTVANLVTPATALHVAGGRDTDARSAGTPGRRSSGSGADSTSSQKGNSAGQDRFFLLSVASELFVSLADLWLQGEAPGNRVDEVVAKLHLLMAIGNIYAHVLRDLLALARPSVASALRPFVQKQWQTATQAACVLLARMAESYPLRFDVIRKNTGRRSELDGEVASLLLRVNAATGTCLMLSRRVPAAAARVVLAPNVKLRRHEDKWNRFWGISGKTRNAAAAAAGVGDGGSGSGSGSAAAVKAKENSAEGRFLLIATFVEQGFRNFQATLVLRQQQPGAAASDRPGTSPSQEEQEAAHDVATWSLSSSDVHALLSIFEQVCTAAAEQHGPCHGSANNDAPGPALELNTKLSQALSTITNTFLSLPSRTSKPPPPSGMNVCLRFFQRWLSMSPHDSSFAPLFLQAVPLLLGRLPRLLWQVNKQKELAVASTEAMLACLLAILQQKHCTSEQKAAAFKQLIPFFYVQTKSKSHVLGPFLRQALAAQAEEWEQCQRLATSLLYYADTLEKPLLRAVSVVANARSVPVAVRQQLLQTVQSRKQADELCGTDEDGTPPCVDLDAYLSFLMSILAGNPDFINASGTGCTGGMYSGLESFVPVAQSPPPTPTPTPTHEAKAALAATSSDAAAGGGGGGGSQHCLLYSRETDAVHEQVCRMLAFAATRHPQGREYVAAVMKAILNQLHTMSSSQATAAPALGRGAQAKKFRPGLALAFGLLKALGGCARAIPAAAGRAATSQDSSAWSNLVVELTLIACGSAFSSTGVSAAAQKHQQEVLHRQHRVRLAVVHYVSELLHKTPSLLGSLLHTIAELLQACGKPTARARSRADDAPRPATPVSVDELPSILAAVQELMVAESLRATWLRHGDDSAADSIREKLHNVVAACEAVYPSKSTGSAVTSRIRAEMNIMYGHRSTNS